jgi:hypothetical protein
VSFLKSYHSEYECVFYGQKSTCTHIKAVNYQDKKKFKNMDITGTVNIQCSDVYIKSTVDLQFGERYASADII